MTNHIERLRQARDSENLLAVSSACREALAVEAKLGLEWAEVAALALEAGDEVAARNAALKLTEEAPAHLDSWTWLAAAHSALGENEAALNVLERLLSAAPKDASLNRRAGRVLLDLGRTAEAEHRYRQALHADASSGSAWEGLAASRRFRPSDSELVEMEQMRIGLGESADPVERGILSYALAKAYEDQGEYDLAARRIAEGAAFYRSGAGFNIEAHANGVDHVLRTYDDRFADQHLESGLLDARPVFVIAAPGCAADWLTDVLAAGEDVARLPRNNALFWMSAAPLGAHTREDLEAAMRGQRGEGVLAEVGRTYLRFVEERVGRTRRVIDPASVNELAAGAASLSLPAARFIVIERDPADLAWACYKRRFRRARHWTYHPDDVARVIAANRRLVGRWSELFPDRVLRVSYEALLENLEDEIRRIAFFSGVEADASVAEAWMRQDVLNANPAGLHKQAGERFVPVAEALERAGLS
ncbi:MAG: sulfotransferase [Pseudomonadota bacterium]